MTDTHGERTLDWFTNHIMPWAVLVGLGTLILIAVFLVVILIVSVMGGDFRSCIIGQDGLEYCR